MKIKHRKKATERAVVVSASIPLWLRQWADREIIRRHLPTGFSGLVRALMEDAIIASD